MGRAELYGERGREGETSRTACMQGATRRTSSTDAEEEQERETVLYADE